MRIDCSDCRTSVPPRLRGWPGGLGVILAALLSLLASCTPKADQATAPDRSNATASQNVADITGAQEEPAEKQQTAGARSAAKIEESWDAIYIEGTKIGYTHTRREPDNRSARPLVRIESQSRLSLERFGQTSVQRMRSESLETPDGRLVSFQTEVQMGSRPVRTTGRIDGDQLLVNILGGGKKVERQIAWPPDVGGFHAVEHSLRQHPLAPGKRRRLRALMPLMLVVAEVELVAKDYEPTPLAAGATKSLLRIESTTTLPDGNRLSEIHWTDRQGEIYKTRVEPMGMESMRTTGEVAMADDGTGTYDLGFASTIDLDRPLPHPRRLKRVHYRMRLKQGDPSALFAADRYQQIRSLDEHTAELTVTARPAADSKFDSATPDKADLEPNELIQCDDPLVVRLARQAAGESNDPRVIAAAMEQLVNRTVSEKNFTQALASAAEVARSREGDCTEHAVLLAALARARGIPARVAIGLVYVEGAQAFAYHMWDELLIDGQWTAFDATFPEGGSDATHIKVADSDLRDASGYSCFLPVTQLLGQLEIEVSGFE